MFALLCFLFLAFDCSHSLLFSSLVTHQYLIRSSRHTRRIQENRQMRRVTVVTKAE